MSYDESDDIFLNKKDSYKVKLETFEGPLDLLLYLVKSSEINIFDISISEITGQYLNYLSLLITYDMDNISEFIEMASTLIYLKSKSLLPVEVEIEEDDEEDITKEDLINKLLEYQKYKIASSILEERALELGFIPRKVNQPALFNIVSDDENWKSLSIIELVTAFAEVLNKKEEKKIEIEIEKAEHTVEEKIRYLIEILKEKESINYYEILDENMSKLELICYFLAILELVKLGVILIRQHKLFDDIQIFRRRMPTDSDLIKTDYHNDKKNDINEGDNKKNDIN